MPKARRKRERSGLQELQSRFRAERFCLHRSGPGVPCRGHLACDSRAGRPQHVIFPYTFSFSFLPQRTQRPQTMDERTRDAFLWSLVLSVRPSSIVLRPSLPSFVLDRHFDTADDIGDNLPGGCTAVLCLGSQEDAVRQHIRDKPQHVVGNYKISLLEECASPGCAREH